MNALAKLIADSFANGGKLMVCGNGGSAAQAQHFVAELVGRFERERLPLPAISLCSDVAVMTAIANDFGFEEVFARQVRALGKSGDVLMCISTSGKSLNVLRAAEAANAIGMAVVHCARLNGLSTAEKQEMQLEELHEIARQLEDIVCKG